MMKILEDKKSAPPYPSGRKDALKAGTARDRLQIIGITGLQITRYTNTQDYRNTTIQYNNCPYICIIGVTILHIAIDTTICIH